LQIEVRGIQSWSRGDVQVKHTYLIFQIFHGIGLAGGHARVELRSSGPDTRLPTMRPGAVSQIGEHTLVMPGKSQIESDVRSSIPLSGVKAGITGSESRWKESNYHFLFVSSELL
jgi:hypothetical protein